MSNELTTDVHGGAMSLYDDNIKTYLDKFEKLINTKPNTKILKSNKFANNAKYIPIGIIQMKLDQVFLGHWEWIVTDQKVIGNAVTVSGNLKVLHPFTKVWLTRSGVGAIPIELQKGSGANEADKINAKAVSKNYPAANAEAFKNAAKTLGNMFGRHLNRDFDAEYRPEGMIDEVLNEI